MLKLPQLIQNQEEKFQRTDFPGGRKPACSLTWEPVLSSHGFSSCNLSILVQPPKHQIAREPLVWGDNSSAVQPLILTEERKGNPKKRVHKYFHPLHCHTLTHIKRYIESIVEAFNEV